MSPVPRNEPAPYVLRPPSAAWLRCAVAFVWLATGLLVFLPSYRAIGMRYLDVAGLPHWVMPVVCAFEVVLGLRLLWRPYALWLAWLQIALIGGFTAVLGYSEPKLLIDPFGVLGKNAPLLGMIATVMLLEGEGWSRRAETAFRLGMASIWILEGLVSKVLFSHEGLRLVLEGILPFVSDPGRFILPLGLAEFAAGLVIVFSRGRLLSLVLGTQCVAVTGFTLAATFYDPALWVHPFGPLTKNVPIIVGLAVLFLRVTPFLTARWSHVVLFTHPVSRAVLENRLPPGVVLDERGGEAFISFVSLDMSRIRILGVPVPFIRKLPDINLRGYVRRGDDHGVMFIRELVPLPLVAWAARAVYREPFETARIVSEVEEDAHEVRIARRFLRGGREHSIQVVAGKPATTSPAGGEEDFFKERYWGFGHSRTGGTIQYRVDHPVWKVFPVRSWELEIDWEKAYGPEWSFLQNAQPRSVVVAEGSEARVWLGV